jgi:hypothetical protein
MNKEYEKGVNKFPDTFNIVLEYLPRAIREEREI